MELHVNSLLSWTVEDGIRFYVGLKSIYMQIF